MSERVIEIACEGEVIGKQALFQLSLPGSELLLMYTLVLKTQTEAENVMMALSKGSDDYMQACKNVGRLSDIRAAMRRAMARTLPNFAAVTDLESAVLLASAGGRR